MSIHPAQRQHLVIGQQRCEVAFKDGTFAVLHPVFDRAAPMQHHRALRLDKGMNVVVDLRALVPQIGPDISLAAPRDQPGIVFFTLRHHFATAELFVRAACEAGHVLCELEREAA